jgi:RecA-family ATPase
MKVRTVRYRVPGRFAFGKQHLSGGRSGSGKWTLLREGIADFTRGRPAFGLSYEAPATDDVLLVCREDGPEDTVIPGLAADGADLDRADIIRRNMVGNDKRGFTLSDENIELIRKRLAELPSTKVMIIDPVASYVGKLRVDDNRAAELRAAVLDPLNGLAEQTDVTIILGAHLIKGNGDALD